MYHRFISCLLAIILCCFPVCGSALQFSITIDNIPWDGVFEALRSQDPVSSFDYVYMAAVVVQSGHAPKTYPDDYCYERLAFEACSEYANVILQVLADDEEYHRLAYDALEYVTENQSVDEWGRENQTLYWLQNHIYLAKHAYEQGNYEAAMDHDQKIIAGMPFIKQIDSTVRLTFIWDAVSECQIASNELQGFQGHFYLQNDVPAIKQLMNHSILQRLPDELTVNERLHYSLILLTCGLTEEGAEQLRQAYEQHDRAENARTQSQIIANYAKAIFLMDPLQHNEAMQLFDEAARMCPDSALDVLLDIRYWQAKQLMQIGDVSGARAICSEVLATEALTSLRDKSSMEYLAGFALILESCEPDEKL